MRHYSPSQKLKIVLHSYCVGIRDTAKQFKVSPYLIEKWRTVIIVALEQMNGYS